MKLHELKPSAGSKSKKVRKGRGTGSGLGKTAGRGQDGQNSRTGGGVRIGFEGGQMPLVRRVPKRGFSNYPFKEEYAVVNVERLNSLDANTVVTNELLKELGMVKNKFEKVKILGNGEITKALTIKVNKVTKSAAEKIVAAGGKVEVL